MRRAKALFMWRMTLGLTTRSATATGGRTRDCNHGAVTSNGQATDRRGGWWLHRLVMPALTVLK
jgi:hypothetical protein